MSTIIDTRPAPATPTQHHKNQEAATAVTTNTNLAHAGLATHHTIQKSTSHILTPEEVLKIQEQVSSCTTY